MNVLQLMAVLKQRLKLANAIQLFLFIDGTVPYSLFFHVHYHDKTTIFNINMIIM